MSHRFENKVAVITGAGSGIAREIARRLSSEGATIVAGDVSAEALQAISDEFGAIPVIGDTADDTTGARLVETALAVKGSVDLLVNAAGVHSSTPTIDLTPEQWRRHLDINLSGYFYVARAVGAPMIAQRNGVILNIASTDGVAASLDSVSYIAAKHGVVGLTRSLAVDWAQYGIRVNALAPGLTLTPPVERFEQAMPDAFAAHQARIPFGRVATAAEQASIALFLLSDDSTPTTGQVLVADGGSQALYSADTPHPKAAAPQLT